MGVLIVAAVFVCDLVGGFQCLLVSAQPFERWRVCVGGWCWELRLDQARPKYGGVHRMRSDPTDVDVTCTVCRP